MHDSIALMADVECYGHDGAMARVAEAREALRRGNEAADACTAMRPGPALAAALVATSQLAMDNASRIKLTACWERLAAWTEAQKLVALADAAGTPDAESDRWVVADVALSAHLSEATVDKRLATMRRIGECLPRTYDALAAGAITYIHVLAIHDVTRAADPDVAQAVDAEVIPKATARSWTPDRLRDAARTLLLKLDPEGSAQRRRRARKDSSDVTYRPDEDDLALLVARGDAWTGRRMMDEINRRADAMRRDGDGRPLGELRFQALADAVLNETPQVESTAPRPSQAAKPRRRTPARARALVVIDLQTLLGLADNPGHLDGHGPVTAEMARRIAADAMLRRLVLDPLSGKPVDLGRHSYRLSKQQRRWIEARDRRCTFPNCRRRAVYCDADHAVEWNQGGETTCDNCGLLCRRHHNFKTSKAWRLARGGDGAVTWTSPHGFAWINPAATYDYYEVEPRAG